MLKLFKRSQPMFDPQTFFDFYITADEIKTRWIQCKQDLKRAHRIICAFYILCGYGYNLESLREEDLNTKDFLTVKWLEEYFKAELPYYVKDDLKRLEY